MATRDRVFPRRRSTDRVDAAKLFQAEGEMSALMRTFDWSRTPLGSLEEWPSSLRTMVGAMLGNRHPMAVWWGPEFLHLYNDAYRPILGDKHPASLCQSGLNVWNESWQIIGPMAQGVLDGGPATWNEHFLFPVNRRGFLEETYFTFSYSPIPDEEGRVRGVLLTTKETTTEVQDARQLRTLRDLAAQSTLAKDLDGALLIAAHVFGKNAADIPFAMLYAADSDDGMRLVASTGMERYEANTSEPQLWPFSQAARMDDPLIVHDVRERLGFIPAGQWKPSPEKAVVIPLWRQGLARPYGFLVSGVNPLRTLDERYRGFFRLVAESVVTSISNALSYEEERRRAEELAELDRAKTTFFANISHEFRTPLTLMLGPTEEALSSDEAALRGSRLEMVYRNELRLLKLVNTLLDFSRIEAGRAQAHYEATDLSRLTNELAAAFRSAIERAGIAFDLDCPPLEENVFVDPDMWEKIVLNLISNAIKFTFAGHIGVSLRIEDSFAVLRVWDTGVGISSEDLGRIFERFYRAEGIRSRTHEGSGIGLALVRDLVQLHGGQINVASSPGKGSEFTVRIPTGTAHLPADRIGESRPRGDRIGQTAAYVSEAVRWLPRSDEGTHDEHGSLKRAKTNSHPQPITSQRVLVVDDSADMREYLTRLLKTQWSIDTANDGMTALSKVRANPPDIIVTDTMMPNLDGFGLIAELRRDSRFRHIPIMLLSARAGEESRVEGLASGADDYLVKPFYARELKARVAVLLDKSNSRSVADAERRKFRSLLRDVPAVVNFLRGPDLVFEFAHPLAVKLLGDRNLVGKPLLEAMPELANQEFPKLLRRVIDTGERLEGKEKLVWHYDEAGALKESYWDFVYLPVRNEHGQVEGVMTFDLDVTEKVLARKTVEEHAKSLAETNALLENASREAESARHIAVSASRAKDEFLAMLGHELRNPLSPILNATEIMRLRGHESDELSIIERQVVHLVRLVDDLLDISRIARGVVELRRSVLEMATAVQRGVELALPLLDQRRQTLEIDAPATGLPVEGDADRLAQVVSNLVTNASKYSDRDSTIRIHAERVGDLVQLRVHDDGIGINADMLDKIFDTFVQQPQALDRSVGGLGLGLSIVRNLVQLHGGTVRAESEGLGKGSDFIVELPVASDIAASLQAVDDGPEANDAPRERQRILVVDDNVDAAHSLAAVLETMGQEVRVACDGTAALEIAREFIPSVGLLDIGLPGMDGYSLAKHLRSMKELPANLRLIAVTGYGQDSDHRRSIEAGFDDHVVKPATAQVLSALLHSSGSLQSHGSSE